MINLTKIKKIYLVGIKGAGMTALAQVLQKRKIQVLGSDVPEEFFTDRILRGLKIKVIERFNKRNVPEDIDLAVISAAYLGKGVKNEEVEWIKKRNIPILTYAQVLGALFKEKFGIAVAGTHGKSTTTAMLGLILEKAGLDPTVVVGAEVLNWQSNARTGDSKYLVAEADEYRNNFLHYLPKAMVLTRLEYDHPDFFKNFEEYQRTFSELIDKIPSNGFIIANFEDPRVKEIIKGAKCSVIGYGFSFDKIELKVPGRHNLLNGQAALSAALKLGVKKETAQKALAQFKGLRRRFEIKDEKNGVIFVDDYAHHPTEIQAVLKAARDFYPHQRIWAVFQPHTFSRTKALLSEFARSFDLADQVIILDIYGSARENSGDIHSRDLVNLIRKNKGNKVVYLPTIESACSYLKENTRVKDVVLTIGAGDVWRLSTVF
jgi:UDP-N-acetylmuramate--alanine ligase